MIKDRLCGTIVCFGKETGKCGVADQLQHQAQYGSGHPKGRNVWEREKWEKLVEKSKRSLPHCAHPDQLNEAIETIIPTFVEDLTEETKPS